MLASTSRSLILAVVSLILIEYTAAAIALPRAPELTSAERLVDWVVKYGGTSNAMVKKSPETGLRGLYAKTDIKEGDVVLSVPVNISMDIGPASWTPVELAVSLLRTKVEYPSVWEGFQPYLGHLPGEGDVHTAFSFKKDLVPLLQDPEMEAFVKQALDLTEAVFSGAAEDAAATMADLKQLRPKEASQITLGELQRWASIIESYSFGGLNAQSEAWQFLVPLLDMANHNEDPSISIHLDQGRQAWVATTLHDIRKGEELTRKYGEHLDRNDVALLHHFFLNEQQPPRLCSHDLPRAGQADGQEPFTDMDYAPGGRFCTMEEAMRLAMKLASFPTTESQDRAALERKRNPIRDWRERTIMEFRVLRKQALRLTVEAIKAALQTPKSASAAATPSTPVAVEDSDGALGDGAMVDDDISRDEVSKGGGRGSDAPPVMGASKGPGSVASGLQANEGAAQRGVQGSSRRKPRVVVPLADADVGLQEPKFLKINTPSHSEL